MEIKLKHSKHIRDIYRVTQAKFAPEAVGKLLDDIDTLLAEIDRLNLIVTTYAEHRGGCAGAMPSGKCICGLDAALKPRPAGDAAKGRT